MSGLSRLVGGFAPTHRTPPYGSALGLYADLSLDYQWPKLMNVRLGLTALSSPEYFRPSNLRR